MARKTTGLTSQEAANLHHDFFGHDYEKESVVNLADMKNLTFLGYAVAIRYEAQKYSDKKAEWYEHEFDNPTMLLTNGKELICFSPTDDLKITKRGIEG
jgi:hypothetical protein